MRALQKNSILADTIVSSIPKSAYQFESKYRIYLFILYKLISTAYPTSVVFYEIFIDVSYEHIQISLRVVKNVYDNDF